VTDEGMPLGIGGPDDDHGRDAQTLFLGPLLEAIPREDQEARSVRELCAEAGVPDDALPGFGAALTAFLVTFGAITASGAASGDLLIKAKTRSAAYFTRSLSAYIREGSPVLRDWGREANPDGSPHQADMLKGPQFLTLMERERRHVTGGGRVHPLRETHVSQAVIKARVRGLGTCYLHEYNRQARMFQPIGGHQQHDDASETVTMQREAAEELPKNDFDFPARDQFQPLGSLDTVDISRTTGVNTLYHFSFYLARFGLRKLRTDPAVNRWIREGEVSAGQTRDGIMVATQWARYVEEHVPAGCARCRTAWAADRRPACGKCSAKDHGR
jgi:hypothetical protein